MIWESKWTVFTEEDDRMVGSSIEESKWTTLWPPGVVFRKTAREKWGTEGRQQKQCPQGRCRFSYSKEERKISEKRLRLWWLLLMMGVVSFRGHSGRFSGAGGKVREIWWRWWCRIIWDLKFPFKNYIYFNLGIYKNAIKKIKSRYQLSQRHFLFSSLLSQRMWGLSG